MFVGGALGGVIWILIPTLAKAYANVSELITTLLLNFVGVLLAYYVPTGPWLDPGGHAIGTTARVRHEAPEFWGTVHWGFPWAILLTRVVAGLLNFRGKGCGRRLAAP